MICEFCWEEISQSGKHVRATEISDVGQPGVHRKMSNYHPKCFDRWHAENPELVISHDIMEWK